MRLKHLLVGLALSSVCIIVQSLPNIYNFFVSKPAVFLSTTENEWTADISRLSPGAYYVSVGRPRLFCDLLLDDKIIASNRGPFSEVFSSLMIGVAVVVKKDEHNPSFIKLSCSDELKRTYLGVAMTHLPIITNYFSGLVLQSVRMFIDIILGPLFSLALLISVIFNARVLHRNDRRNVIQLLFVIIVFFYTISLAHYPRLFISIGIAAKAHMIIRSCLALGFVLLVRSYLKVRSSLIILHCVAIVLIVVALAFSPIYLIYYIYAVLLFIFTFASVILLKDLFDLEESAGPLAVLRPLTIVWLVAQIGNLQIILSNFGAYFSPAFFAVMTCMISYLRYTERFKAESEAARAQAELLFAKTIGVVASQVAHDIRSPIAALNMVLTKGRFSSDHEGEIAQSAINRIKEVANDILQFSKQHLIQVNPNHSLEVSLKSNVAISGLIESLVREKQTEFQSRPSLIIRYIKESEKIELYAKVNSGEFSRVISNLINNAADAISDNGLVAVTLKETSPFLEISIEDNGKGIPFEIIPKLMRQGSTFDKKNGLGLGLFYAKNCVDSWNGKLEIKSEVGRGTVIRLLVPTV